MKRSFAIAFLLVMAGLLSLHAQDSVDVTFYHYPESGGGSVHIPGEFNGWNPSSNESAMSYNPVDGSWYKTIRLRVGGPDPLPNPTGGIEGAYQYKFHDGDWFPDPLNPRINPQDHGNTYLYTNAVTIHLLLPNETPASGVVRTRFPVISAYLFPQIGTSIDTASIAVTVGEFTYTGIGTSYNPGSKKLSFIVPDALADGTYDLHLSAANSAGLEYADSTSFTVSANMVQFYTLPAETWKSEWPLRGAVFNAEGELNTDITSAQIVTGAATYDVSVNGGLVDTALTLEAGTNEFTLQAEVDGNTEQSTILSITKLVEQAPYAQADIFSNGSDLFIQAGNSTDPQDQVLSYLWSEYPGNPEDLLIDGSTDATIQMAPPTTPGEYYVSLTVEDEDGNQDSTRTFFTVSEDGSTLMQAENADNAQWVKDSRIYIMFFKAFTPEGTIAAAIPNLDYVAAMGFNTIWVLPVMEIPGDVDNQINIGYRIEDLYSVESSLGTSQDYKDFVAEAHSLGMRVIQDVTPNHVSDTHPIALEAALHLDNSQYWEYFQTEGIPHDGGLSDCQTPEGIYYYCEFSSALLNWDWRDIDARTYMIDVYEHWVREYDIDGYRLDVHWGPYLKFGRDNYDVPLREALRHAKADILLLGESRGTGVGTELQYADQGGGLDVAYDWSLYHDAIGHFQFNSSAISSLHGLLSNNGYYPGENSYFLRFMENQDEDRITYRYGSFEKTMPMATVLMTAPGMPAVLNGQETGFGLGMGAPGEPDLNDRRRGIIDWEFPGVTLLQPHYQKITQIRAQFPAFRQHRQDTNLDGSVTSSDESDFDRVFGSNPIVYAFLRPWENSSGLTMVNFSSSTRTSTFDLSGENLKLPNGFHADSSYWLNNLYNQTSMMVTGAELSALDVTLDGYGSAVYTISTEEQSLDLPELPALVSVDEEFVMLPEDLELLPNYPNPFNPTTTLRFYIPEHSDVDLKVFDLTGREVSQLLSEHRSKGYHEIQWSGLDALGNSVSTGVYLARIEAAGAFDVIKMIYLK